jgi:DNA-binding transcriptional LysR family regulator
MNANPDDLLVLLAVSRSAKFTTAAQALGLNHTTVSRRIAALEKALGGRVLSRASGGWELTELGAAAVAVAEQVEGAVQSLEKPGTTPDPVTGVVRMTATDGFSAYIAAPAVARLRRHHPGLSVEIITVTRRALQQRSGLDIEVVVGEPQVHRARRPGWASTCWACTPPGATWPNTGPRRRSMNSRSIRWSTSSTQCCRSMTSTPRGGWCRPCATD